MVDPFDPFAAPQADSDAWPRLAGTAIAVHREPWSLMYVVPWTDPDLREAIIDLVLELGWYAVDLESGTALRRRRRLWWRAWSAAWWPSRQVRHRIWQIGESATVIVLSRPITAIDLLGRLVPWSAWRRLRHLVEGHLAALAAERPVATDPA